MLGRLTDYAIAKKLGIDAQTVRHRRLLLGIESASKGGVIAREWTAEEIALLGTMTDIDVGLAIGRNRRAVSLKRRQLGIESYVVKTSVAGDPEVLELLGKVPDKAIAELFGLHPATIAAYRARHGIFIGTPRHE